MNLGLIVGLVFIALLAAACWFLIRHPPSAADERRAVEESRVRAQQDVTNMQRRPGTFGGH